MEHAVHNKQANEIVNFLYAIIYYCNLIFLFLCILSFYFCRLKILDWSNSTTTTKRERQWKIVLNVLINFLISFWKLITSTTKLEQLNETSTQSQNQVDCFIHSLYLQYYYFILLPTNGKINQFIFVRHWKKS